MKRSKVITLICAAIAIIIYTVGYFGMTGAEAMWFAKLTPFTLVLSAILLAITHGKISLKDVLIVLLAGAIGFGAEVVGVATGEVFGSYHYGESLGPKWFGVSLVIGLNWAILTYCTMVISSAISKNSWVKACLGAALMVAIDILIEPVAIQLDFWHWKGGGLPPMQNYLAWFVIAFLVHLIAQKIRPNMKNNFSIILFFIMVIFFSLLNFKV